MMMRTLSPASSAAYGWNDFCSDPAGFAEVCAQDRLCSKWVPPLNWAPLPLPPSPILDCSHAAAESGFRPVYGDCTRYSWCFGEQGRPTAQVF